MNGYLLAFLLVSGPSLDVHVDGQGLMRFASNGRAVYAKRAKLTVENGLVGENGAPLLPEISAPAGLDGLDISLQGELYGLHNGSKIALGTLVLALFPDEKALAPSGGFLISADRPTLSGAGDGLAGVLRTADAPPRPVKEKPADVVPEPPTAKTKIVAPYVERKAERKPEAKEASVPTSIQVKPLSTVGEDKILLGDIAEIQGNRDLVDKLRSVVVGAAPLFGYARGIDRASIEGRLRGAGFKPEALGLSVPYGAKIQREAQTIPSEQFVSLAVQEAQRRAPGSTFQPIKNDSDFPAPKGSYQLAVESCTLNRQGAIVTVSVTVDGNRYGDRTVLLKSDTPVVGIQPGAPVTIVIRSGGAVVEIAGTARTGGYIGDTIQVVADTGSVHQGVVLGPGRVEVKL